MKRPAFFALIFSGVFLLFLRSLLFGGTPLALADVFGALFGSESPEARAALETILEFRLPLLIQAFFLGGLLAVSGAALQAVLQNPLAEPYILGTSSGAAFGLTLASVLGFAAYFWLRTLFSFAGGTLASLLVFLSARRASVSLSPLALILSGIVIGTFLQAASMAMQAFLSPFEFRTAIGLLLGNFYVRDGTEIALTLLPAIAAGGLLYTRAIPLDILSTGFAAAESLGLNTRRELTLIVITVSFITALAVSLCGIIAFVGLVAPHLVRKAARGRHTRLLPAAFIAGGCFTVLADVLSRALSPWGQVPAGAFTAILGAPIFLLALRRYGRNHDHL
jgi:iron complex transport system permease protein